jgi:hypothetical protein
MKFHQIKSDIFPSRRLNYSNSLSRNYETQGNKVEDNKRAIHSLSVEPAEMEEGDAEQPISFYT